MSDSLIPRQLRVSAPVQAGPNAAVQLAAPPDKSCSHRALMLASIAQGTTHITNLLEAGDVVATRDALTACGAKIERQGQGEYRVQGTPKLHSPQQPLDFGNAGTGVRLAAGLFAGQGIAVRLTGDASLSQRPMQRIVAPLEDMGSQISTKDGCLPLVLEARSQPLQGLHHHLNVASAQIKSCLLLATLGAEGETSMTLPESTRDHTARMLRCFGVEVVANADGTRVSMQGGQKLTAPRQQLRIVGDISSATFFFVAAGLIKDCPGITMTGCGINPTRTAVLDVLKRCGMNVALDSKGESGGEPCADITVSGRPQRPVEILPREIPVLIDEIPALMVLAASLEYTSSVRGAGEMRLKESDRIATTAAMLRAFGTQVCEFADGMTVTGTADFAPCLIDSRDDHRIAMAAIVASARSQGSIAVDGCQSIATSFPNFVELAAQAGYRFVSGTAS